MTDDLKLKFPVYDRVHFAAKNKIPINLAIQKRRGVNTVEGGHVDPSMYWERPRDVFDLTVLIQKLSKNDNSSNLYQLFLDYDVSHCDSRHWDDCVRPLLRLAIKSNRAGCEADFLI